MAVTDAKEITVKSSLDSSAEKSLFYFPAGKKTVPLVVGLHTWSFDRKNQLPVLLPLCRRRGWAFLLPEFRGPNLAGNPRARQACASRLAKQDILDALNWVIKRHSVDRNNIFLIGGSGGGHMALMMAAQAPERWRTVSAWCPITDLATWYRENRSYAPGIAACCGGPPGTSPEIDRQYRERSPLFHTTRILKANLSVHHGRFDTSVPYTHALRLALDLEKKGAKNFFFEIFDGAHEIQYDIAFRRFDKLAKLDKKVDKLLSR